MGEKHIASNDKQKIFLKPSREELAHMIFYATYELNPPFYINYYSKHERSKMTYIIRQLKINYPNKIIGYYSYNNETCILYNTRNYTSNVTSSLSLVETEI